MWTERMYEADGAVNMLAACSLKPNLNVLSDVVSPTIVPCWQAFEPLSSKWAPVSFFRLF